MTGAQTDALRAVLARVPVIAFAFDADLRCTLSEGGALRSMGLAAGQLVGTWLPDVLGHGTVYTRNLERALAGESFRTRNEVGDLVFDTMFEPLRDDQGDVVGGIGVSVDVTGEALAQWRAQEAEHEVQVEQRAMLAHLHEATEAERLRIAGDVHNDTLQVLAGVDLRLQLLARALAADVARAELIEEVRALDAEVRGAGRNLRRILHDLEPPVAGHLDDALAEYARMRFHDTDVVVTVDVDIDEEPPEAVRRVLFRIAQEAMTNTRRHAGAHAVGVHLRSIDGEYVLRVVDDGTGVTGDETARPDRAARTPVAATSSGPRRRGHGLLSMRERARAVGGTCTTTPAPSGGTVVEAHVPKRLGVRIDGDGAGPRAPLAEILESITDGFAALDTEGRCVYLNSRGGKLLSRGPEEAAGRALWRASLPGTAAPPDPLREAYERARADMVPVHVAGYHEASGSWLETRVYPSRTGTSVFFVDVSEQVERRRALAYNRGVLSTAAHLLELASGAADLGSVLRETADVLAHDYGCDVAINLTAATAHHVVEGDAAVGDPASRSSYTEAPITAGGRTFGVIRLASDTAVPPGAVGLLPALGRILGLRAEADRARG